MNINDNNTILEAVEKAVNHKTHFYCYRLPGETQLHFGAQIIEQHTPIGFLVHPFTEDSNTPISYISAQFDAVKFLKLPFASLPTTNCRQISVESTTKEDYIKQAEQCISDLKAGTLKKIVLSRVIESEYSVISWKRVFCKLLENNPNAFVFIFHAEDAGCWIGASPEQYLSFHRNKLATMALAGTRLANTPGPWGDKEIEEQKIVADYIAEKLNTAKIEFSMSPLYTRNAGNVEHLCNDFDGRVNTPSQVDKIKSYLHPTPALAGLPSKESVKYIKNIENHNRRYYGGYIGPVDAWGNFDFFVNLRSLEFDSERYCVYTGGGLTVDSDPEKEWQETEHKARPLLNLL